MATTPSSSAVQAQTPQAIEGIRRRVRAAAEWLARAQDATPDGGAAAFWAPLVGWAAPYPETSGYIVPTLWRLADILDDESYAERALRMTDWLLGIQSADGWFPGGKWRPGRSGEPSVFNTGQILFGLVEATVRTGREDCRAAALRASAWLSTHQDEDGRWRIGHYRRGYQPSYYAHVCWPLALCRVRLDDARAEPAVRRGLDHVLSTRTRKDSFTAWAFVPGRRAFTHTIAYTIQGLLESALLLDAWDPYGAVAHESALRLLRRYEIDHRLAGAYDENWKGAFWYRCLTGHCQLASTWLRLHERTGDARFLNAAIRALREVSAEQRLTGIAGVRGGIAGSDPHWGLYMSFRYPNWAAKFFIDALLDLERALVKLEAPADVWDV